ncbi:MAG: DUF2442 domain-containing protein [Pseudomonadota bacterium]
MSSSETYAENERPIEVWCDPQNLHVRLNDGREVVTPLWWYPKLLDAAPAQRNNFEIMIDGVHWPDVDEDLSIRGMLRGWRYPKAKAPAEAA